MPARHDSRQLTLFEREPHAARTPASISFRSYCSSSAGNCLALWTPDSCVLIDCGIKTLRDCRSLVSGHRSRYGPVASLLVSHSHGDHLSRSALRVMQEEEIDVLGPRAVVSQVRARHDVTNGRRSCSIRPLPDGPLEIGDFRIVAIPLAHVPGIPTYGFVVRAGHGGRQRKIVVCTDFCEPRDVLPHLSDADFLFIEANHDADLLARHFNPNSRYHSSNERTARLLVEAVRRRAMAPRHVVLGHLSDERNRAHLALGEVERAFAASGMKVGFALETAPLYAASRVIAIT